MIFLIIIQNIKNHFWRAGIGTPAGETQERLAGNASFPYHKIKSKGGCMKRYFFFDIDGTLTTPRTADYPDSAREAVRRLQEEGNFVAIASGRLQADAVDVAEELGIDSVIPTAEMA